ncbi:MAG TPA: Flp pilus assembly protein CpaB, partial [Candidatus Limnocylindrales bacterium]|nr:Flp pilus assembly protein CpaB [Candidatus Limnocylindrales bacterium]
MKRSNRLVLLVGVFLAIVAFIAIIVLNSRPSTTTTQAPTKLPTVVAATDIPLGAKIKAEQVKIVELDVAGRSAGAYGDISQVLNKTVRQDVVTDQQLTPDTFGATSQGQIIDIEVPPGKRAITVEVDQVTGVGTVIKTGDYVDMVVLFPPEQ